MFCIVFVSDSETASRHFENRFLIICFCFVTILFFVLVFSIYYILLFFCAVVCSFSKTLSSYGFCVVILT